MSDSDLRSNGRMSVRITLSSAICSGVPSKVYDFVPDVMRMWHLSVVSKSTSFAAINGELFCVLVTSVTFRRLCKDPLVLPREQRYGGLAGDCITGIHGPRLGGAVGCCPRKIS